MAEIDPLNAAPPQTAALEHDRELRIRGFELHVVEGPDRGRSLASTGPITVIGTHESADLRLTDSTVSRFHCELRLAEGKVRLTDLESRNGTRAGGVSVLSAELVEHVTLALGRTQVRFQLGQDHVVVPLSVRERFGLLVGRSRAMRAVFATLERAAASDLPVLLEGETGTGKDLAAQSIHQESARAGGPLVVVDCGSLPATLIESELFGHERGAFTGAHARRVGAFEAASGGTLFLDEIGELDLELQPKLLRALESGVIRRVGGAEDVPVDVRVLAATNRNLRREVNERHFRSDLYFRLAVLEVQLPPLRERPDDLEPLLAAVLDDAGADAETAAALATAAFVEELRRHTWPGNVRELRNYVERCVAMRERLPFDGRVTGLAAPVVDVSERLRPARQKWLAFFEEDYLRKLLAEHGDNVSAAARAAGVARVHLHRLLSRYGIR